MIDAGSSGSRVHIYKFNHCKEEPELENEVFKMLQPGLSSFGNDSEAAVNSLEPLLELALESVPKEVQSCTPIAVKATAGLRLLGADQSNAILKAVETRLSTKYPFPIADKGIEIMEGKDEGVYAWITVNYLLGKLKASKRGETVATFDLGGASTQIVFEPEFDINEEQMLPGDHQYELEYAHQNYNLYQHSYLGFGLNEAKRRIKEVVVKSWGEKIPGRVFHPCLPEGHKEIITYESKKIELVGTGAGHAACRGVIEKVFGKEKACALNPCAFDGVYQPPLMDTFTDRDLYVFSYFYDLIEPLGMPLEFSVRELGELANRVCGGEVNQIFGHLPNALHAIKSSPDYCLDLTYTHALLRVGYDVSPDRLVRTAKKIRDAETGWCLGASIAMIDNNQICKK